MTARIYLLAVLAIVSSVLAVVGVGAAFDVPGLYPPFARFVLSTVVDARDDPQTLRRTLSRVRADTSAEVTVYDVSRKLLGSTVEPPYPPLDDAQRRRLGGEPALVGRRRAAVAIRRRGEIVAYGQFSLPPLAPLARYLFVPVGLFLLCLALGSALLARSLVRPLRQLAKATHAFGRGELGARVRLERQDELGRLGRTFDEMADRIAELLRAQKELLADVSHELRTPLSRIRVAVDIAQLGDGEQAQQQLLEIAEDLGELERLVSDILMAARLDLDDADPGAALPLRCERLAARSVLVAAAERFRRRHAGHRLEVVMKEPLPAIRGDRAMLRRAIDNGLDNAGKYSDEGSRITLLARRQGEELIIEIQDEGIGLSPEDLRKVFRPFFRADNSRSKGTGGVGLGLSLSRRIIEAHGGAITLDSQEGRGTTLRVSLPAC